MGAASLVMLGQDAFTAGDSRSVRADGTMDDGAASFPGYVQAASRSLALAQAAGTPIRWVE